jgi:hypothetical protein
VIAIAKVPWPPRARHAKLFAASAKIRPITLSVPVNIFGKGLGCKPPCELTRARPRANPGYLPEADRETIEANDPLNAGSLAM